MSTRASVTAIGFVAVVAFGTRPAQAPLPLTTPRVPTTREPSPSRAKRSVSSATESPTTPRPSRRRSTRYRRRPARASSSSRRAGTASRRRSTSGRGSGSSATAKGGPRSCSATERRGTRTRRSRATWSSSPGAGRRTGPSRPTRTPGTFYSALSNVDLEIGGGNAGAVGVRAKYAQHCFTSHVEFRIGSGLAGVHEGGNVAEDVRFVGGEYGIWTRHAVAGLAVHPARRHLRGPAAGRHPRAGGRPHAHPPALPERADGDRDRAGPARRALREGRPVRGRHAGRRSSISLEDSPRTQINMENVACRGVRDLRALPRERATASRRPAAPTS